MVLRLLEAVPSSSMKRKKLRTGAANGNAKLSMFAQIKTELELQNDEWQAQVKKRRWNGTRGKQREKEEGN